MVQKALKWFWEAINLFISVLMILMITLVFINVVLRYGFNSGILFSAEISRWLFVWVSLLGAVLCLRDGDHLELRLIEKLLPEKVAFILRRIVFLIIIITCAMLVDGSWTQVGMNWYNKMPMSGLPVSLLYLAGVVSGTLMLLIALYKLLVPSADRDTMGDQE